LIGEKKLFIFVVRNEFFDIWGWIGIDWRR